MAHGELARLVGFLTVLTMVAVGELAFPRRPLVDRKGRRWGINLSLVFLDTVAVRALVPVAPLALATTAADRGWGLLHIWPLPPWIQIPLAVIALDLVIYLQHRLFHRLPLCWRVHRVHHTDLDLDVTTGNRFHPLEIALSVLIKCGAVVLLGASAGAVLAFELLLNATSQFSHGNLRLPAVLDRWLRLTVVTPDMHLVHHSVIPRETDSNFGFCLPWWDRLLGTYRPSPEAGRDGMTIGLREFRSPAQLTLARLLALPFRQRL
jgi:sterol desaturase/sphingolipid hydroxylase (fatty acid hydroxylase superfamily)